MASDNDNIWLNIFNFLLNFFIKKEVEKNDPSTVPVDNDADDVDVKMNTITMKLERTAFEDSGIYGTLSYNDDVIAVTLEHSFDDQPKVPVGTYQCNRSAHRLESMTEDFITFQVMNVPNHTNILFHWGNYNKDSDGCILLGQQRVNDMITNSKVTWQKFMDILEGQNSFILEVSNA